MRLRAMVSFAGQVEAAAVADSPPSVDLIGWWRADDLVQADGSDVVSWTDRSGNTGSLTVPPGASAPTFTLTSAALNNLPAVTFGGGVRQLSRLLPSNYPVGGAAFSLYVVHDPVFSGSVNTMFGWGQNYTPRGRMAFSLFSGSPWTIAADAYASGTNGYVAIDSPQISSVYSATSANMQDAEVWVNGSVPGAPTGLGTTQPFDIPSPVAECKMGGLAQETSVAYQGQIAEVIVYSKNHTGPERTQTLSYLAARYGITLS